MTLVSLFVPSTVRDRETEHRSNLARALRAFGWMYSSRALVFGWALLLTHQFGIAEYGVYAMAFAAGAVLGVPLDSYFSTRSPRVSARVFLRERSTRALVGVSLVGLGVLLWPVSFVAGFAVVKAGSDSVFQASRSSLVRAGLPDRAQAADALRQVIGLVVGCGYLLLATDPSLPVAAGLYLAGTAVPVALAMRGLDHAPPATPEMTRRSVTLLAESVGGVAYVHAEVLVLGLLGSTASAGYYSFAATILWSLASLGQSFGHTFHGTLRDAGGDAKAGPPLSTALWLSAATAAAMGCAAVLLSFTPFDDAVWITFAVLAPVSFLRTLSSVSTVVLSMQHRDRFRLEVTAVSVTVKLLLLLALHEAGGPGAALAFLASDVIMSGSYAFAVYGGKGRRPEPVHG